MKPKKLLLIVGGIILVAALLCLASTQLSRLMPEDAFPTPTEAPPVELSVRARGVVVPEQWAELAFEAAAPLVTWEVEEGERVVAGQELGRLEESAARLALQQAQLELEAAQLRLDQATRDHAYQLQEAELSLQQAEARLSQSRSRYPSVVSAQVDLERAEKALTDAHEAYRRADETPGMFQVDGVRDHYQEQIDRAEQDLTLAQARMRSARGEQAATSRDLDVLDAEVVRAQLTLERVQEGVDPALAQEVERAELRVAQAERDLEARILRAPFAGTVVQLHLRPQAWAQPGVPALTLADLDTLCIETTDLDEWGAARIGVGSRAEITVSALDEHRIGGRVAELGLRGENLPGGDVAYATTIALDEQDPALRWGMSVRISLPIEE